MTRRPIKADARDAIPEIPERSIEPSSPPPLSSVPEREPGGFSGRAWGDGVAARPGSRGATLLAAVEHGSRSLSSGGARTCHRTATAIKGAGCDHAASWGRRPQASWTTEAGHENHLGLPGPARWIGQAGHRASRDEPARRLRPPRAGRPGRGLRG